jgi:prepilin-type processing-associated H-X9-DG protein
VFETRDENAGRRGRCPACQRVLLVPKAGVTADEFYEPLEELGPQQTSGKAVASLILGLMSPFLCFFTGLPAIILGSLGLSDINNPKMNVKGKGMAITGMVLGGFSTLGVVPAVLIALLLPAVQAAREAARRAQCVNNLKMIGLAMHNYESSYGCFPPAATFDADGEPLLSWRVLILPFVEEKNLYDQFHLDEPWDSPHNQALAASMPKVFTCPSEPPAPTPNQTTYAVVIDPHSMFTGKAEVVRIASITDGTSNTLLVTESKNPVPWTQPEGLTLNSTNPQFDMGSKHPGGWNVLMADGSVRFFKTSQVSEPLLKALVTRDGNEVVSPP